MENQEVIKLLRQILDKLEEIRHLADCVEDNTSEISKVRSALEDIRQATKRK